MVRTVASSRCNPGHWRERAVVAVAIFFTAAVAPKTFLTIRSLGQDILRQSSPMATWPWRAAPRVALGRRLRPITSKHMATDRAPAYLGMNGVSVMKSWQRANSRQANTAAQALPSWQQSMLRIKDPSKSLAFYQDQMGMRLLDKLDFESMGFSLYFLASIPADEQTPEPGSTEAHSYLWNFPGTTLELTHNYGTENKEGSVYHAGNQPREGNHRDGFGHIAFSVGNVYEFSEALEAKGIGFQKKPNEGRMKGLAFALDPDGYWVELLGRGGSVTPPCLAQTMLRVKDPKKSIEFYTKHFGMKVLTEGNYGDFSLYYLGSSNYKEGCPVLELTHNHGTEDDADFTHFTGNEDGRKGFGHVGFLVDDVYKTCVELQDAGYELQKSPDAGSMKGLAFARDPDGYWVEVIKRGGYDAQATPYFFEESKP